MQAICTRQHPQSSNVASVAEQEFYVWKARLTKSQQFFHRKIASNFELKIGCVTLWRVGEAKSLRLDKMINICF